MAIHFEELWEKCEQHFKDLPKDDSIETILDELIMKIDLYKKIALKADIPIEEQAKVKSRTMGEILLSITHLSLKDNLNVFEDLSVALQYRNI